MDNLILKVSETFKKEAKIVYFTENQGVFIDNMDSMEELQKNFMELDSKLTDLISDKKILKDYKKNMERPKDIVSMHLDAFKKNNYH